ncbi:Hypothetical predicted protein [Pelobates cultripes]|uniref:Uncharacterized protein n=1 Tax=Pelobates cultripes TaxID=61616 RepID=A0AAD1WL14_PELCU|nr:Hypothetical predicted protein [Pelobates cultripes]
MASPSTHASGRPRGLKWQQQQPKSTATANDYTDRWEPQLEPHYTYRLGPLSTLDTLLPHRWTKGSAARIIAATNCAVGAHPAPTGHRLIHSVPNIHYLLIP